MATKKKQNGSLSKTPDGGQQVNDVPGEPIEEEVTTQKNNTPLDNYKPEIYKPTLRDYKLKMLLYGPPGVGKTTFAATADIHPFTKKVLFINIEGGMLSVADAGEVGLQELPDAVDLKNFAHLDKIFWWLAKGDHPYQTVVLDSLSELQLVNLDSIVEGQLGKVTSSGARRLDMDDVWLDDYGKSTQQLRRVLRKLRNLPMHVIFTCLDATSQDKEKNERVHPALTPKIRGALMGYMDIVGYMYTQEVEVEAEDEESDNETEYIRRILCQPYGKWSAKDRSPGGRLGIVVDDPTVPKFMELITGERSE